MPYREPEPPETTRTIVIRRPGRNERVAWAMCVLLSLLADAAVAILDITQRAEALTGGVLVLVVAFLFGPMFVWGRIELIADRSLRELRCVNRMRPIRRAVVRFDPGVVVGARVDRNVVEGVAFWVVRFDDGSPEGTDVNWHLTETEAARARESAVDLLAWLRNEPPPSS